MLEDPSLVRTQEIIEGPQEVPEEPVGESDALVRAQEMPEPPQDVPEEPEGESRWRRSWEMSESDAGGS